MFERLLKNHVLANLTFILVLVIGSLSYLNLPRQQDPTINFNWIIVQTLLPGASALDVEKKITDPLEDAIRKVQDIKFLSSNSRESISTVLIRFEDVGERIFDKRINDLRREIQNAEREFPDAAEDPVILEITSANAFPAATVAVIGIANDERLRVQARNIEKDLEQLAGVDRVDPIGLADPELQVSMNLQRLEELAINPSQIADTVAVFFQDIAAGDVRLGETNWLVRVVGSDADPVFLSKRTVVGSDQQIRLEQLASVGRARSEPSQLSAINGRPAVVFAVMKQANANTIELVERIRGYLDQRNPYVAGQGLELVLVDDQTQATRDAINKMQSNAIIGLSLVLFVTWLFLGSRIALLTSIGIPFILAGTFWVLSLTGETLNVMVLLGVVIVLGMLVDDAVVVVESVYYRLRHHMPAMQAIRESLDEVATPVLAAVLTTMAAFAPLILLPGILGEFMKVVPMVVVIALAISLVEAFWMLPAHILVARVSFKKPGRVQQMRVKVTHWIQTRYIRLLVGMMRHRTLTQVMVVLMFIAAMSALTAGWVKVDFFASDTKRIFYINVEMPAETPLDKTLQKVMLMESIVRRHVSAEELRQATSYAGTMFTQKEARFGDQLGQVLVGLKPQLPNGRSVDDIIAGIEQEVLATPGPLQVSFLRLNSGPPAEKPISVKVRGDDYERIREAAAYLEQQLATIDGIRDISDDASKGRSELVLSLDEEAISRAGISPLEVSRTIQLLADGIVVAEMRDDGEKLEVRVKALRSNLQDIAAVLDFRLTLTDGRQVPLRSLLKVRRETGIGNMRHYNFRRAITVEADIDDTVIDTVTANRQLMAAWQKKVMEYPDIDLDFSGELDDIYESLDAIFVLFVFGVGVMYAILGTQFRSYWQPLMILSTLFMAFTGVVLGLLVSGNPLSLYTLYGVVALGGIAVNSAIVLISAGNARLRQGMSLLHATIYAARRRVIPVLITSMTTVAGLFSLAAGLGGHSLIWGPLANAIVWGLIFSTVLTLIVIPMLYSQFMSRSELLHERHRGKSLKAK